MDRLVILVDAGYLLSQAVQVLSAKSSRSRADLRLHDAPGLIRMLVNKASAELGNDKLLRVYWYDGIKGGLSAEHRAIVDVDDVQMRAGTVNGKGQQKGVDSKIVIDLIELATNQAMSDAMLVTGDGDLAIGIELSQRHGIRVAVLGIEDRNVGVTHNQNSEVTNVADRVIRVGSSDLSPFLTYVPKVAVPTAPTPPTASTAPASKPVAVASSTTNLPQTPKQSASIPSDVMAAVQAFVDMQTPPLMPTVISNTGAIDKPVDRSLIYHVYMVLGQGALTDNQKRQARAAFRQIIRTP